MPAIDLGLLNCFYTFLLLLGVFYAIVVMVAGGVHSIHIPFDLHLGHIPLDTPGHVDAGSVSGHDVSLLSLSPISIAAFITSFGGVGIIATQGFNANGTQSLLWAIGGALVIAVLSHLAFFYIFIAPQASSAVKTADVIGVTAEVTAPIPGDSVGEIAYVAMGERHTSTARSNNGRTIPRGALVTIESLAGTVVVVKLKE